MDPFREQVPFAPTDNFDAKGTETSEDRDAAKEAVSLPPARLVTQTVPRSHRSPSLRPLTRN
jgi:hypothetical protein